MLKSKKTRSVMVVSGEDGAAMERVVGSVRVVERKRRERRLKWGGEREGVG